MPRETFSRGSRFYLAAVCTVAALGGFLFGFDTAVISGCIGFLEAQFALSAWTKGYVVSSALIGCICGAAAAGWLSDRFGRRRVLMLAAGLFLSSAIGSAIPHNVPTSSIRSSPLSRYLPSIGSGGGR